MNMMKVLLLFSSFSKLKSPLPRAFFFHAFTACCSYLLWGTILPNFEAICSKAQQFWGYCRALWKSKTFTRSSTKVQSSIDLRSMSKGWGVLYWRLLAASDKVMVSSCSFNRGEGHTALKVTNWFEEKNSFNCLLENLWIRIYIKVRSSISWF